MLQNSCEFGANFLTQLFNKKTKYMAFVLRLLANHKNTLDSLIDLEDLTLFSPYHSLYLHLKIRQEKSKIAQYYANY